MPAILFGSISTLVDTSELQRRAFNESFAAHGLDWNWSREEYVAMLGSNGGAQRIADYAQSRGDDVDAASVHATKSQIFQELLGSSALQPRPGVIDTVQEAKRSDHKLAFVTTTSQGNIDALLAALRPHISAEMFDLIVNGDSREEAEAGRRGIRLRTREARRGRRFRGGDRRQRRWSCRSDRRWRHMHRVPQREHGRC